MNPIPILVPPLLGSGPRCPSFPFPDPPLGLKTWNAMGGGADLMMMEGEMTDKFKPGDEVTIHSPYNGGPEKVAIVKSVNSRMMTLNDGSKWSADGLRPWGSGHRYGTRTVHVRENGDAAFVWRRSALHQLVTCDWKALDDATLRRVLFALKEPESAK